MYIFIYLFTYIVNHMVVGFWQLDLSSLTATPNPEPGGVELGGVMPQMSSASLRRSGRAKGRGGHQQSLRLRGELSDVILRIQSR